MNISRKDVNKMTNPDDFFRFEYYFHNDEDKKRAKQIFEATIGLRVCDARKLLMQCIALYECWQEEGGRGPYLRMPAVNADLKL